MPIEQGKRYSDWRCSICGEVYAKRNKTRRDVLNAWWSHVKKKHPKVYKQKKAQATKKAIATRKRKKKRKR